VLRRAGDFLLDRTPGDPAATSTSKSARPR